MKLISKFQWKKVLIWSIPLLLVLAYLGFRVRHASPSGSEPTLQDILEEIATDGQESYVTKRVIRHLPELRGYLPQLTRRLSSSEMEVRAALAEITGLLTEGLSSNDRKRADFAHSFGHLSVYVEFAACQPSDRRMFLELLDAAHGAMTRWPGLTSSAAIAMSLILGGRAGEAYIGILSREDAIKYAPKTPDDLIWANNRYRKRIASLGLGEGDARSVSRP